MTIKELLRDDESVYFSILPDDKDKFLKSVKEEGFIWLNGNEIKETDYCNGHMAVHRDMHIASVPWFAWFHPSTEHIKKLDFSEFLKGYVSEPKDRLVSISFKSLDSKS